jgi:hypothetical protein
MTPHVEIYVTLSTFKKHVLASVAQIYAGRITYIGRKKLTELEAQNTDLDPIYPSESPGQKCCVGSKRCLLLAISALIVVVTAVVLGVVLFKGSRELG